MKSYLTLLHNYLFASYIDTGNGDTAPSVAVEIDLSRLSSQL